MLESIKAWIISILIAAFIVNIVNMILPSSKLKSYINLVLNFIFIFIAINPVINFFRWNKFRGQIIKNIYEI
ncbi:stage III sporulation protein AF [Paraclostridium sp. AKS73]|uniref:stage III sporulation protein AF n=1 Tax=Paraclostridium sp. AKS73 TaxID=2876116 RepID=UPI0021E0D3AB|nr:stage III sporulation protein AF [Paraclostridium sp. AKS73]MCU9813770.1 stage III sporulation protein AF [Paraclostridium sp. AKS73]